MSQKNGNSRRQTAIAKQSINTRNSKSQGGNLEYSATCSINFIIMRRSVRCYDEKEWPKCAMNFCPEKRCFIIEHYFRTSSYGEVWKLFRERYGEHHTLPNSTIKRTVDFKTRQSFEPPSSTLGGIYMCGKRLFCREFNSKQLLFKAFFHITGIFHSVQPLSESAFLFRYNKFWDISIFRASYLLSVER